MSKHFFADLHIHSKYSRATSKDCDLEHLSLWGQKKGISVIGTGDFTHPAWMAELKEKLIPAEDGLFRLKTDIEKEVWQELPKACHSTPRFMLSVEVSTIYKKGDKTRKIHHLIYAPTIEQAEHIQKSLGAIGNIGSDGRPILGLDSRHLLEIVLEAGEGCFLVPAHIWTPWFAVLGSKSGFDNIADCYGDLAEHIFAVETGLSSDPEMNWRVKSLDKYRLMSNSDAHSPPKLGREACRFESELNYFSMLNALKTGEGYGGTVEFFPEEGKYHLDGHRKCGVRLTPEESKATGGRCPVCTKPLTLGVLYRIDELADRNDPQDAPVQDPYQSLIPLPEVFGEILKVGPTSKRVAQQYENTLGRLGAELSILSQVPVEDIQRQSHSLLGEAIARLRSGQVYRDSGFDGEYGVIKVFAPGELDAVQNQSLFGAGILKPSQKNSSPKTKETLIKKAPPKTTTKQTNKISHQKLNSQTRLDAEQQKAVEHLTGPILVLAGPGSGKTRVLTHRVAHLIKEQQVAPEQCLTITFTRRAASEMQERLAQLLPGQYQNIPITTFHGLGWKILQENRVNLGLNRGFRVMDAKEKETLSSEESGNCLTYEELITLPIKLLQEDEKIRQHYQTRFRFISIDEYQDIDAKQYELIRLLIDPNSPQNICAIGDPDQSIYGFRGADVNVFLNFEKDFSGARCVSLKNNYRSSPQILKASQQMITPSTLVDRRKMHAMLTDKTQIQSKVSGISGACPRVSERMEKSPFLGDRRISGACSRVLQIHEALTDKAEAEFIVKHIEELLGGSTFFALDSGRSSGHSHDEYSFGDIAVLYRSKAQAEVLSEALSRAGFPSQNLAEESLKEIKDESDFNTPPTTWDPRADRIHLMTLHAAKGLEFPVVFIAGCETGLMPFYFGGKISETEMAEERRLFFVGMTRAQDQLILSHARRRFWQGKMRERKPSPFLKDIEEALLEKRQTYYSKKKQDNQLALFGNATK